MRPLQTRQPHTEDSATICVASRPNSKVRPRRLASNLLLPLPLPCTFGGVSNPLASFHGVARMFAPCVPLVFRSFASPSHASAVALRAPVPKQPHRSSRAVSSRETASLLSSRSVLSVRMAKFFAQNIDRRGRIVRAAWGLALIIASFLTWSHSEGVSFALLAFGAFGLYEAARGWCLMRACGIRTKF